MNKIMLIVLIGLLSCFHLNASNPRIVTTLNESWKFSKGDSQNVLSDEFDDSNWERVTIPHTWNRDDAVDEVPGYYSGF